MKILFYLPILTQKWLDSGVRNLIEVTARDADVHVIVPAAWLGTGLDPVQFASRAQIPGTTWHFWDAVDHASLRTQPYDPEGLVRLVKRIGPDYTICRSADVKTPCAFPGKVAFLMEADYGPLPSRGRMRLSGPSIFSHGAMPTLSEEEHAWLGEQVQPIRQVLHNQRCDLGARDRFFRSADIATDRLVVGIPLEHDGQDNFFMLHSPVPLNESFVAKVAGSLDERCVLALTLHPAQRRDSSVVARLSSLCGNRVRIFQALDGIDLTPAIARHCHGMAFRDSKSVVWAGLFEKPLYRLTRFKSGAWLNAYETLSGFNKGLIAGPIRRPDSEQGLLWLAFHLANNAFDPLDSALNAAKLIDRIENSVNSARWQEAMEREKSDVAAAANLIETAGV